MPSNNDKKDIKEVWAENLEEEMAVMRDLVEHYPYLAMDTEFPGVVARPIGNFRTSSDYHYQTLRCNVDLLKIIQLGLTFADENGHFPQDICTWQFNFKFNLVDDMYAQDSIDLLLKSGIDFKKHEDRGIDVEHFGELLISSGFVLVEDVKWISFHSGYDFGYLLKLLTCSPLPAEEAEFFDLLRTYFPCIYDIKYCIRGTIKTLKSGLQDIADDMGVARIGPQHQAGSDSLLTASVFFKMREAYFNDKIDDSKYLGFLFGLGTATSNTPNVANMTLANTGINNTLPQDDIPQSATPPPLPPPPPPLPPSTTVSATNGKINLLQESSPVINNSDNNNNSTNNISTNTNTNGTTLPINST